MQFFSCIRFRGTLSAAELDDLERRVRSIDADAKMTHTPSLRHDDETHARKDTEDVDGLIRFSSPALCALAIDVLHGFPTRPEGSVLSLFRVDGQALGTRPPVRLHSRIIHPLPVGTSKAILLDSVRKYGVDAIGGIFYNVGGLVRFASARAAKKAEDDAALGKLLVLGTTVTLRAVDERKVFCTDLSPEVAAGDLRTLFERHGEIVDIYVNPEKKMRGRLSRYAVVTFSSNVTSVAALRANNGNTFFGRVLRLFFGDLSWGSGAAEKDYAFAEESAPSHPVIGAPDTGELEAALIVELLERIAWQKQALAHVDLPSERERQNWQVLRASLQAERDAVVHQLEISESRRKMLEMDLDASREKERMQCTRTATAERALRELQEKQQRCAADAKVKEEAEKRRAREAEEQRRSKAAEEQRARAEARRRAEEARKRLHEEELARQAQRAQEELLERRRAAVVAEEDRCTRRDARWPCTPGPRWTLSSYGAPEAYDRFLVVSREFDIPKQPFCDLNPLVVRSVPWPVLAHPSTFDIDSLTWDMVGQFMQAIRDLMGASEYRRVLKDARLRFHPDRWAARGILQAVVDNGMRAQMERACKAVSQAINDAVREMEG
ncbi:hypothetical protein HDZ31DRAFT_62486 [Schizophyllum fasciatum]